MEDFKTLIDKVISGELQNVNSDGVLISPGKVDMYLKREGLEQGNFDSNGWDFDFWMEYFKDGKKFTLSGNGWYNNGLSFYSEIN